MLLNLKRVVVTRVRKFLNEIGNYIYVIHIRYIYINIIAAFKQSGGESAGERGGERGEERGGESAGESAGENAKMS